MSTISNLSSSQLRKAAKLKEKILKLYSELDRLLGISTKPNATPKKRRKMSAAGRARIAAAQKARWAKVKGRAANPLHKPKRKLSAAARAKIAAAAKARWAAAKAAGKTRL
jgi:hypothetical protein